MRVFLFLVASMIGMAIILSFGNPAKVFADIKAFADRHFGALTPFQSTPTIQSTADAKALPTARGVLTRDEIATTFDTADSEPGGKSATQPFWRLVEPSGGRSPPLFGSRSEGLEAGSILPMLLGSNRGQLEGR